MAVINIQGEQYELPKLTLTMQERLNAATTAPANTRAGLETKLKFLQELVAPEILETVLDGSTVDDIDITELVIMVESISAAYTKPLLEERLRSIADMTKQLGELATSMNAIQAADKPMKRAGFTSVK